MRAFLGAFGDPGHAFPMLALGAELVARGHEVTYETWSRWREPVEAAGMRFAPAPEYPVFPTRERPMNPYEAVVAAVADSRPALVAASPDVVIHDVLTLAPALIAELEAVPTATLIPHLYPVGEPGLPPFGLGARAPRTAAGARLWRGFDPLVARGLERGRQELNDARRQVGLDPVTRPFGGQSTALVLVGAFPQLEYPRTWPEHVHVVGPLLWEPGGPVVDPPPGEDPLVLIATSTAQDPDNRMLRAALTGLSGERLRTLAVWNGRPMSPPVRIPANARVTSWLSYARTMPDCALVVSHGGSGTVGRALASGTPLLAVPHGGDMPENAARLVWSGAGRRLPWPLLSPLTLRRAVRGALADTTLAARAGELAAWARVNDGAARAADLVERLWASARG
ncbi:MAG TPA: nucleotide disphospho-sugar-binding domain-containing protein [Solirubrobacteraceae bacterium]|nr:nucleotide disphospho-sugar-binding domain-containing protein [Solirubrobacteraceae bacterium]